MHRLALHMTMLLALVSCGDDSASVDAALGDTPVADAALDGGADATDFTRCEGACAVTNLSADFGGVVESLDLAFFGVEPDGSLRVEIYGGAADECPTMDSPSPDRTIVIPSISPPRDTTPVDVVTTLLDFEGTLTSEPLLRATSATATPMSARLEPLETAFVRFDLVATFEGGMMSGSVYATHCASLDG